MINLVNLKEQEEKPKAIIMAGGAGVGKTFVTDKFKKAAESKGWVILNPDQYARNPDPEQRLSLAAAGSKINKQIDGLTKSEDKPNIIWDTTATNPSKIEALKNAGYDVLMIMVYAHPSVSFEQNFSRAGKDGEESLPPYVVLKTWIDSYNNDHVKNYKNMFGDNFILVNNTDKPGTDQSKINAFNKAAQQGGKALEKHIEGIISKDPEYYTSSQMVAKPSNLTPEQLEDFNSKVQELNLRFLEEGDEEILKREYQKYFEKYNELMPSVKVGRRNGMKEVYASKMKNKLKNIQEKNKVYNDISSTLKDIGDTTDLDKATNIALQYIGANGLSEFLVNNILNEEEEKKEKSVALFGGGFKPPTKGHLQVVQNGLLKHLEDIDRVKIIIGGGIRDGITPNQSEKIWNIYKRFIPVKTDIIKADMFSYYKDYLRKHKDDKVYIFVGSREGNEKDAQDVQYRQEYAKKYSDNVVVEEVSTVGDTSGTKAREYFLSGDKKSLRGMLPEKLTDEEFDYILDILNNKSTNNIEKSTPKSTEPLSPINEDIIDKTDFVLPRGEQMILQAEDEDYDRGLIVELTEEGGYKMNYWYGDDAKIYPVEVEVDGKSIKPDAREVYMKFHPELEKEPINENATYSSKIDYKQQIKDLTKHMLDKGMNILPLPRVIFKHSDVKNASQFLGKTAYYMPDTQEVVLYTEGRHPKDIARSFAHEMIHHIQNLEGRLDNINTTNTNDDDHLNDIEREAYTRGNMVFRNWTDNMDGEEVSSLNESSQFTFTMYSGITGDAWEKIWKDKNFIDKVTNVTNDEDFALDYSYNFKTGEYEDKYVEISNIPLDAFVSVRDRDYGDDDDFESISNLDDKEKINAIESNDLFLVNLLPYKSQIKTTLIDDSLNEIGDASSKVFSYKKTKYGIDAKSFKEITDEDDRIDDIETENVYEFETDLGTKYVVNFEVEHDSDSKELNVEIDFTTIGNLRMDPTNKGEQYAVMATLSDIIINWINEWDKYFYISMIWIEPKVEDSEEVEYTVFSKRGRLYKVYLDKQISRLNKSYEVQQKPNAFKIVPTFKNLKETKKQKDPFGLNQFARELIQDNPQPVKEDIKSLAPQEEDVIFNKNCGCDKT